MGTSLLKKKVFINVLSKFSQRAITISDIWIIDYETIYMNSVNSVFMGRNDQFDLLFLCPEIWRWLDDMNDQLQLNEEKI